MPYLVTTRREGRLPGVEHDARWSRVAVATLAEARDITFNARVDADAQIVPLAEAGGTFGPLPDGTVVDVTAVCWNWIVGVAEDRGLDVDAIHADSGDVGILAALNEAGA